MKDILNNFLDTVNGNKTYVLVVCAIVLWVGIVLKWWTWEQVDQLYALLGMLGVAAGRSALKKLE